MLFAERWARPSPWLLPGHIQYEQMVFDSLPMTSSASCFHFLKRQIALMGRNNEFRMPTLQFSADRFVQDRSCTVGKVTQRYGKELSSYEKRYPRKIRYRAVSASLRLIQRSVHSCHLHIHHAECQFRYGSLCGSAISRVVGARRKASGAVLRISKGSHFYRKGVGIISASSL
jgi:hypothetical protein